MFGQKFTLWSKSEILVTFGNILTKPTYWFLKYIFPKVTKISLSDRSVNFWPNISFFENNIFPAENFFPEQIFPHFSNMYSNFSINFSNYFTPFQANWPWNGCWCCSWDHYWRTTGRSWSCDILQKISNCIEFFITKYSLDFENKNYCENFELVYVIVKQNKFF